MKKFLLITIFIILFSIIYSSLHYYVYSQIVSGLSLSRFAARILMLIMVCGIISFFTGEFLSRNYGISLLILPAFIWMGFLVIAFSIFIAADIIKLFYTLPKYETTEVLLFLIAIIGSYSLVKGIKLPIIRNTEISVPNISLQKDGFNIVQLSDLHLDKIKSIEWLRQVIIKSNSCKPDLVLITGDIIDLEYQHLQVYTPIMRKLQAKYGVFSVTGNHEYYAGVQNYKKFINDCNITDISNKKVLIDNEIQLVGVPDEAAQQFQNVKPELIKTLQTCDLDKTTILLSHQPLHFEKAVELGINLQLSGHTHAGQIPPMDLLVHIVFKYTYGLYHFNGASIYTTCGTGTWGPPMRLFSRSEIVCHHLSSTKV